MKVLTTLATLALLVIQSYQDCCASGCLNGALTIDVGETVELIPKDTSSDFNETLLCGTVFKAKGNCCQYTKMQSFANKTLVRLKIAFNTMQSATTSMPGIISNLKFITGVFNEKSIYLATRDPYYESALGGPEKWQKVKSIWEHLLRTSDDLLLKINSNNYNATQCYETIANQKLNALCMACSGDASNYYDSTANKFKIKSTYCKTLVEGCGRTLDVFTKVVHMLHTVNAVMQSLSYKAPTYTIPDSVSLTRLMAFDNCGNDTVGCKTDSANLVSFCKEIGFLTDFSMAKIVNTTTIGAAAIKTDSEKQFQSTYEDEVTKFSTETISTQSILNKLKTDSSSIQTKMSTMATSVTTDTTSMTDFNTAITAYLAARSDLTKKIAMETKATTLMTGRTNIYNLIFDICTLMIAYVSEDLLTYDKTTYITKNSLLIKMKRLKVYTEEAISQKNIFNTYLTTFQGLAVTVTLEQDNQLFLKQLNQTGMHDRVIAEYNDIKVTITSYTDTKHATLTTLMTNTLTPFKNIASLRKNRITPLKNLNIASDAVLAAQKALDLGKIKKNVYTELNTQLATNTANTNLANIQTKYNSLKTHLSTLSTNMDSAVAATSSMAVSTFFSQTFMQPSLIDTPIMDINTWITTLTASQTGGDTVINSLNTPITAAETAITASNQIISRAESLRNNAKHFLWSSVAQQQSAMQNSLKSLSELTTIQRDLDLIKSQMITLDTNYGNTEAVILSPQIRCLISKVYADLKSLTSESSSCATVISTAESQWTSAQGSYTMSSMSLQNQLASKEIEYNTKKTVFLAKNTTTTTLSTDLWLYQSYIDGNTSIITTEKALVELKTKEAVLYKEALLNYTNAIQSATTTQLGQQLVFMQECLAVCTNLKSLLSSIAASSTSPPSNFKSTLTNQMNMVKNLLNRVNTLKSQVDTSVSQVSTDLSQLITNTATRLTGSTTNVTDLTTALTTATATNTTAQATYDSTTARRLLQTYDDLTDFLIDDGAGGDTDLYKNGIVVNSEFTSTDGYVNNPAAAQNTSASTTEERGLILVCLFGILSFGVTVFL